MENSKQISTIKGWILTHSPLSHGGGFTFLAFQGTMRCTPTNVPLWEIPI